MDVAKGLECLLVGHRWIVTTSLARGPSKAGCVPINVHKRCKRCGKIVDEVVQQPRMNPSSGI